MHKLNKQGLIELKRVRIPVIRSVNPDLLKHQDRDILLNFEINQFSVAPIVAKIRDINKEKYATDNPKPIRLYLDSPGGVIADAVVLATAIRRSKVPVHVYCDYIVASAALLILAAAHRRFATDLTLFMHHHMQRMIMFGVFAKAEFHNMIENYELMEKNYYKILIKRSNLSQEEWTELVGGKTKDSMKWFGAEDALRYGIIDEIEDLWELHSDEIELKRSKTK